MLLRQGVRRLAFIAGVLLAVLVSNELSAQTAACRAACDRDYGDHPGRFSACVNQCPRAPQRPANNPRATDSQLCDSKNLGTPDERIRHCTSLINSPNLAAQNRANAYFNRAANWVDKKNYDNAISDYNAAIELRPNDAEFYSSRGDAFRDKGDFNQAIDDYSEAIRVAPTAENYNARCYGRAVANRDLNLALADCDQALRRKPNDADTLDSRGFVYLRQDRFDDAVADYNAALKFNPKLATALYGRGLAKLKRGDIASGNADLAAAKNIQADIADTFSRYGLAAVTAATPAVPPPPASAPAAPPPAPAPTTAAVDCAFAEVHWKSVETIGTVAAYLDHLKRFSNCAFADLARMKIEAMKK
jgi:tetratricopeptide (TPR) repeat protein